MNEKVSGDGRPFVTLADLDKMPRFPGICFYCERDTMVYALGEFTCRKCVPGGMELPGGIPARPSPAEQPGQRPPSGLADQRNATCANCRKPIGRTGAGADWYHRHNASTFCYPGRRSPKRAEPSEIEG